MKYSLAYLLLFVLASVLCADDGFRTWQMIGGGHFEAKLTAVASTKATLQNREGKTIDFPLADLKPSDQDYVRDWQMAQSPVGGTAAVAASVDRSAFANRVYKKLLRSKGARLVDFEPEPGDNPQYFAFYRSALWCPPCRAFTPKLVDFYDKYKRKGAPFELVFISSDKSEDLMAEYMDEYDMEWPAFEYGENKDIVDRNGTGIPNLIITDANGKKLLDSYSESGDYIGPTKVMAQFEELLKEAR